MFVIKEIRDITNAIIINGNEDTCIKKFNVSKKNHNKDDFYIPIFWREDRQKYIIDAVRANAIGYIISSKCDEKDKIIRESIEINPDVIILQVEDVNEAIYKMAMVKREQNMNSNIVAVTGSVGKTSTTEMIASILREEKRVLSDTGNNNTKLLLSWLMLDIEDYEMAVLEAGMGNKNVMEPISKLLIPSIVVITNIGTSHIGKLGSKEAILEEKLKLITYMKDDKVVFLNDDDIMLKTVKLDDGYDIKRYSLKEANNIVQHEDFISFDTMIYGENTEICINAYGEHSVLNAICAIRVAELLNINKENIKKGLNNYRNVNRRFNVVKKNDYIVIDDTYNASVDSMKVGLISANQMKDCKRKIAILGDMLELGDYSEELHKQVGELFEKLNFDFLLTYGENTQYICNSCKEYMKDKTVIKFDEREQLINYVLQEMKKGDLIYLKASKKMRFDEIVKRVLEKVGE